MEKTAKYYTLYCNCGCSYAIAFMNDFDNLYVQFMMPYFDIYQANPYIALKKLSKENNVVFEIIVDEDDLKNVSKYLKECKVEENVPDNQDFKLEISKCYDQTYEVVVYLKKPIESYPRKEFHRIFDISLSKGNIKRIIEIIDNAFSKTPLLKAG